MKYANTIHVQMELDFADQRVVDFDNERAVDRMVIIRDLNLSPAAADPVTGHPLPRKPGVEFMMSFAEAKQLMDVLTRMFAAIPEDVRKALLETK